MRVLRAMVLRYGVNSQSRRRNSALSPEHAPRHLLHHVADVRGAPARHALAQARRPEPVADDLLDPLDRGPVKTCSARSALACSKRTKKLGISAKERPSGAVAARETGPRVCPTASTESQETGYCFLKRSRRTAVQPVVPGPSALYGETPTPRTVRTNAHYGPPGPLVSSYSPANRPSPSGQPHSAARSPVSPRARASSRRRSEHSARSATHNRW